jgi:hypothetical protein
MFRKYLFLFTLLGFSLSLFIGCASSIIQMPKPVPDIVSAYKSVLLYGDRPGMQNSGIKVEEGDSFTMMARGEVDLWPARRGHVHQPISQILYRIGKKSYAWRYYAPPSIAVRESGNIYLGIADGPTDSFGEPKNPEYYRDNKGYFVVDIIVWKKDDLVQIADFFQEIGHRNPQNQEIKVFIEKFSNVKKIIMAEREKDVGGIPKDTIAPKDKDIKKEKEKQALEVSEKKPTEIKEADKSVVLEDSKAKVLIVTKPIRPKDRDTSPPKISVLLPEIQKEMRVPPKTSRIMVYGKATDESGVAEVAVNGEAVAFDEKGNFFADVLLKVGENEIHVTAMDIHKNQASQSFKIVRDSLTAAVPHVTPFLESKRKYYALVIGNNDYKYIQKLEIAKKDAIEVEKLLRDGYGFETRLLTDATRIAILNAMNDFRKKLKEEDSLLIYYAGHGDYDRVADKAYWLPVDAERDNPTNWIMSDDVTTSIKRMASKHILVVSDSCYSGTFVRSTVTDLSTKSDREGFIKRMLEKTSRTLMSSGGNEPVVDSGGSGHSVFAEALLKGLREIDGMVFTADELFYGMIRERVIGKAEQTPQYNNIRNSGHEGGDFVFMKKGRE